MRRGVAKRERERREAKIPKKRAVAEAHLSIVPAGTAATPAERGFEECPCTEDCILHGDCLYCVAYHGRKNVLPRCERGK
jgi:hypothetical protein